MGEQAASPWPLRDAAVRAAPILAAFVGWHAFWNWMVPIDPIWSPPPRAQTVLTIGMFSTPTDKPAPGGYAFETVDGRALRLACSPSSARSEAARDACLTGGGRFGDHARRYVAVRYYEPAGADSAPPSGILLGAKAGPDWLLKPEDQKARLSALADADRRRKAHWRTAASAILTLLAGFIALRLVRRLRG
ncbi:hypothetical protein AS593_15815 [Caulobacter vibrioides]|nr:hypothetical protein AS593_15815 [Caulobacter vibrioides]